ncbi:putative myosin-binding protein [Helianthus annuus]|nr:putative myosin-binding protein [Helianthus annuus]KAJ0597662.1 putative myosin-binding protein [Helianthus annuus]
MGLKNNNSSSLQSPNYFHRLSKALQFAVSEWLLMFLLFIDACFTYLIAKFASYCQLQGPCVLCSRYDHVLAKDKTGVYWDSFCNHHKSEISSLVITSHVNGIICENCLVNNRFNDETFRLQNHDSLGSRICFCCNEQYGSRDHVKNLLPTNSLHSHASESLITNAEHAKNEKNIFVDESLESCISIHSEKNLTARSSEVEYPKDDDVNAGNVLELPVPDIVPDIITEVHLKADSHFEFSDIHNDSATVATRDIDEVKCQNDEIKEAISPINEPVSFDEVPSSNNAKIPADDFLETINPPITNEVIKDPATTNGHQISNQLDLGDAYKLAIGTKGRQLSGKLLDLKSFNNSSARIGEDLKILLSHRSNDSLISPKLSFNSDELTGLQLLQSRISLERNESNISLDGSIVSEIEGESVVDRLRRQVEHDKKLMGVLYQELEEERNASAVATNQAMAMITRLQEEKAALYTEALQSLRMMEEQAEYDNEALQKANDIIEEKDKQILELEELLRKTSEDVTE